MNKSLRPWWISSGLELCPDASPEILLDVAVIVAVEVEAKIEVEVEIEV